MTTGLLLIGMSIGLVYRKSGNCWADRSDLRAESVDTILRGLTARERKIDTIMETDCPARHVEGTTIKDVSMSHYTCCSQFDVLPPVLYLL